MPEFVLVRCPLPFSDVLKAFNHFIDDLMLLRHIVLVSSLHIAGHVALERPLN